MVTKSEINCIISSLIGMRDDTSFPEEFKPQIQDIIDKLERGKTSPFDNFDIKKLALELMEIFVKKNSVELFNLLKELKEHLPL